MDIGVAGCAAVPLNWVQRTRFARVTNWTRCAETCRNERLGILPIGTSEQMSSQPTLGKPLVRWNGLIFTQKEVVEYLSLAMHGEREQRNRNHNLRATSGHFYTFQQRKTAPPPKTKRPPWQSALASPWTPPWQLLAQQERFQRSEHRVPIHRCCQFPPWFQCSSFCFRALEYTRVYDHRHWIKRNNAPSFTLKIISNHRFPTFFHHFSRFFSGFSMFFPQKISPVNLGSPATGGTCQVPGCRQPWPAWRRQRLRGQRAVHRWRRVTRGRAATASAKVTPIPWSEKGFQNMGRSPYPLVI